MKRPLDLSGARTLADLARAHHGMLYVLEVTLENWYPLGLHVHLPDFQQRLEDGTDCVVSTSVPGSPHFRPITLVRYNDLAALLRFQRDLQVNVLAFQRCGALEVNVWDRGTQPSHRVYEQLLRGHQVVNVRGGKAPKLNLQEYFAEMEQHLQTS